MYLNFQSVEFIPPLSLRLVSIFPKGGLMREGFVLHICKIVFFYISILPSLLSYVSLILSVVLPSLSFPIQCPPMPRFPSGTPPPSQVNSIMQWGEVLRRWWHQDKLPFDRPCRCGCLSPVLLGAIRMSPSFFCSPPL